jgi:hypothetical protein
MLLDIGLLIGGNSEIGGRTEQVNDKRDILFPARFAQQQFALQQSSTVSSAVRAKINCGKCLQMQLLDDSEKYKGFS